jgi:large subunit ribosomal protein L13
MDTLSYKTLSVKGSEIIKEWLIVDAENEILGRLSSKVAYLLRGKHKTNFTPNLDCGDNVIVINAEKILLTGKKLTNKEYVRHTGYPGGQRITTPDSLLKRKPEAIIEMAVKGMIPKNSLGRDVFRNLYVYAGTEHLHEAQKPRKIDLNTVIV